MTDPLLANRRRFLQISAAALAVGAGSGARASGINARWRGVALGAPAQMTLAGVTPSQGAPVFAAMEAEIARLEGIFSLYRPKSALARLNRDGFLAHPAPELLDVLSLSQTVWAASDGQFDPTIQPLWRALAERRSADEIARARATMGWSHVRWDTGAVRLTRPGMALTFNGVAQGYITDRIAALLSQYGFHDVLVDMGEVRATGQRSDGQPWRAGIAAPDGEILHLVQLADRALATSAPMGTVLDLATNSGHILSPLAQPVAPNRLVSVSAPGAGLADALSTAACLLPGHRARQMIGAIPGATLEHYV